MDHVGTGSFVDYRADPRGKEPMVERERMFRLRMGGAVNGYGKMKAREVLLTPGPIDRDGAL